MKPSQTLKTRTGKSRSDAVVSLRLPSGMRDLIDSAASVAGKTRTEFLLESARLNARNVLVDQQLFVLDDAQHDAFVAMLDQPAPAHDRLKALMAGKAPWDA